MLYVWHFSFEIKRLKKSYQIVRQKFFGICLHISTITKVFRHLHFVKLRIIRVLKECVSNIK